MMFVFVIESPADLYIFRGEFAILSFILGKASPSAIVVIPIFKYRVAIVGFSLHKNIRSHRIQFLSNVVLVFVF